MMASINKNTSLSLLDMPPEMIHSTFEYVIAGGGVSSLALTNHRCKEIVETFIVSHWNYLKSPEVDLPKGLVDLSSLIGRIVQSHPENTNPRILFSEITKEFTNLGATITKGNLPLTTAVLHDLQCEVTNMHNTALIAIWPKIRAQHQAVPQLQTADAIRTWLTNPTNAPVLNGITVLDFSGLKLEVLPPEIAGFTQLQKLFLNDNQLIMLPKEISALTHLVVLYLSNNRITSLPKEIGALKMLYAFRLSNNQLVSLPKEIGALKRLHEFNLSNNQLVSLPKEIGALAQLSELDLSNNQLSTLPKEIGALAQLSKLNLSNNQLVSLPKEIGALAQLGRLNLSNNQLISLPKEIGALKRLYEFKLSNNRLVSLPQAIRTLRKLKWLNLSNNRLVSLPKEIGALKRLYEFKLSNNQLVSLPKAIRTLRNLKWLELNNNPLMFISDKVLNSNIYGIKNCSALIEYSAECSAIINYMQELEFQTISPFERFYLSFRQEKSKGKIKRAFYALSTDDKKRIWRYTNKGERTYIDDRIFDDWPTFCLGVDKALRSLK